MLEYAAAPEELEYLALAPIGVNDTFSPSLLWRLDVDVTRVWHYWLRPNYPVINPHNYGYFQ